jgi:putative ABC transport system permease protein
MKGPSDDIVRWLGMPPRLIGLTLGLSGSLALARYLKSALYEVTATDPSTFIAVSLLLAMVAVLACLIPTRRAVSVNPTVALRYE